LLKILGRVDQATKVRGLFIHPGQVDDVAARFPQIARCRVRITRSAHKDEMTFLIELTGEEGQSDKLREGIERSVRDIMKVRGEVQFVPKGTIPDGGKKIEDQRTWE
jgi:phenylacetate-CoA ligase